MSLSKIQTKIRLCKTLQIEKANIRLLFIRFCKTCMGTLLYAMQKDNDPTYYNIQTRRMQNVLYHEMRGVAFTCKNE